MSNITIYIQTGKDIGRSVKVIAKRKYRTLDEVSQEYYRDHPDEIDNFLTEIFAAFAEDGNTPALLASLRVVRRVKGVSVIARAADFTLHIRSVRGRAGRGFSYPCQKG